MTNERERAQQLLLAVSSVPHSLYARKYGGADLAQRVIAGETPWEAVPYLTRAEIQDTPFTDRLYKPLADIDALRVTSGTSGAGVMIIPRLAYAEAHDAPWHHAYFKRYAIRSWATFSSASFFSHSKWLTHHDVQSVQLDPSDMAFSAQMMAVFRPDMLAGFPYALTALAPRVSTQEAAGVRAILLFGERASALQRAYLRSAFPHAVMVEEYTSIEMQSPVGESCLDAAEEGKSYIHPIADYAVVELIHPETGTPITEPFITGEIVVTIVRDVAFPLIRYRTGDAGHIVAHQCTCPTHTGTIAIDGRLAMDRIRFAGGEVNLAEVDRAMATVTEYCTSSDFEVRFSEAVTDTGVMPQLTVVVGWDKQKISADMLAARIANELRIAPRRTWATGVVEGTVRPLVIEHGMHDGAVQKRRRIVRADHV